MKGHLACTLRYACLAAWRSVVRSRNNELWWEKQTNPTRAWSLSEPKQMLPRNNMTHATLPILGDVHQHHTESRQESKAMHACACPCPS